MKTFIAVVSFALILITTLIVQAQVIEDKPQDSGKPEYRNKPVLCMDKDQLIANSKRNGLVPLVGSPGSTFDGQQSTFPAFFLVVYNVEEGNYSFLEFHKDGWACLLGGGRNGLIFDYEEIDRQLDWD